MLLITSAIVGLIVVSIGLMMSLLIGEQMSPKKPKKRSVSRRKKAQRKQVTGWRMLSGLLLLVLFLVACVIIRLEQTSNQLSEAVYGGQKKQALLEEAQMKSDAQLAQLGSLTSYPTEGLPMLEEDWSDLWRASQRQVDFERRIEEALLIYLPFCRVKSELSPSITGLKLTLDYEEGLLGSVSEQHQDVLQALVANLNQLKALESVYVTEKTSGQETNKAHDYQRTATGEWQETIQLTVEQEGLAAPAEPQ